MQRQPHRRLHVRLKRIGRIALPLLVLAMQSPVQASPLTAGDILVGMSPQSQNASMLGEFTPTGTLVETFTLPATEPMEGVAVDQNLTPYAYIGQRTAEIWTVNTTTGVSSTFTYSGLSMVGNIADGQISAYGNYLYATSENGIMRFDLSNADAGQAFFDPFPGEVSGNTDFEHVTVGYNRVLYGLRNQGGYQSNNLITSDPIAMGTPTVITFPEDINALSVDAAGDYFVARSNGIDEYSPTFQLLNTLTLTGYSPSHIDLSPTGSIVATTSGGSVIVTTTQLSSYTTFSASALAAKNDAIQQAAVVFIEAPQSVPEPGAPALIAVAGAMLIARRPARRLDARQVFHKSGLVN